MQSPWNTYCSYLKAIFSGDPEVGVGDVRIPKEDDPEPTVYTIPIDCTNQIKAHALDLILNKEIDMGNIKLKVDLNCTDYNPESVYEAAFNGNPHYSQFITLDTPIMGTQQYCVMNKEVIQFYNDDLSDPWGNYNGLAADIMKIITKSEGAHVNFCTDIKDAD